uniref:Uncharacterized protein n=1 Tax=Lotharella globosa TaxID=91324 RepID=A0A7S3YZE7_9EUKA
MCVCVCMLMFCIVQIVRNKMISHDEAGVPTHFDPLSPSSGHGKWRELPSILTKPRRQMGLLLHSDGTKMYAVGGERCNSVEVLLAEAWNAGDDKRIAAITKADILKHTTFHCR